VSADHNVAATVTDCLYGFFCSPGVLKRESMRSATGKFFIRSEKVFKMLFG